MSLSIHISIRTIYSEVWSTSAGTIWKPRPLTSLFSMYVSLHRLWVRWGFFQLIFTMKCTEQMEYTLLTFIAACCKFKSVSHHFGIKEVQPQPSFSALWGTRAHELVCLDFPRVTWAYTGHNTKDSRLKHQKESQPMKFLHGWLPLCIWWQREVPFSFPCKGSGWPTCMTQPLLGIHLNQTRAGPNVTRSTLYFTVHVGTNEWIPAVTNSQLDHLCFTSFLCTHT